MTDPVDIALIRVARFIRAHARRFGELHKVVAHFTSSGKKGKGYELTVADLERLVNIARKRQISVYGLTWCDKEVKMRIQGLDRLQTMPCVLKRNHKGPCQ